MKATSFFLALVLSYLSVTTAAAVTFPSTVTDGVGVSVCSVNYSPQEFDLLEEAGVKIMRVAFDWSQIEKNPGSYNWDHLQSLVDGCAQHNIRVYGILFPSNQLYEQNPYAPDTSDYFNYQANFLGTKGFRDAFTAYAQATVQHYAGNNFIWELWNEPNWGYFWPGVDTDPNDPNHLNIEDNLIGNVGDYMRLAKGVSGDQYYNAGGALGVIRSADPTATILGPAVSGWYPVNESGADPTAYLNACFQQGLLTDTNNNNKVDGVSVHMYRDADQGPETAVDQGPFNYTTLRSMINNDNIPTISGEWGYMSSQTGLQTQADYLQRMYLTNFSQNIPISVWFNDFDTSSQLDWTFGIVDINVNKKPAYYAMQTLTTALKDATFKKLYSPSGFDVNNDHVLLFNGLRSQEVMAAWTETAGTSKVFTNDPWWGSFMTNNTPVYLGPPLTWHGGASGNWSASQWAYDPGQGANGPWYNDYDTYRDNFQARFTSAATINVDGTYYLSGFQFGASVTLNNGTLSLTPGGGNLYASTNCTINSVLAGGGHPSTFQLRKSGGGTVTLGHANTFTGNLIIYEGSVAANDANALYGSVVTLKSTSDNGGLQFGSGINEFHIGSLAGDKNLNYGTRILDIGKSGVSNDADGVGYSGVLSGSGAINKYGAGTTLLSGTNTYTGATTVYGGMLAMANSQAFGSATSTIHVYDGGIDIRGCTLSRQLAMHSNPITLANTAPGTTSTYSPGLSLTNDITVNAAGTLNLSGTLATDTYGTFRTMTKTGSGVLNLTGTGDNAFMNLIAASDAGKSSTIVLGKTSTQDIHAAANVTVGAGATVQYGGSGQYQVWQNGSITLNGGKLDYNGNDQIGTSIFINADGSTIANSGGGKAYAPTGITVSPYVQSFNVDTASCIDLQTGITCDTSTGNWASLIKTGTGQVMLNGGINNANLTVNVKEGSAVLCKASTPDVHAALALSVASGATAYLGGSGEYQVNGRVELWGGTLDFNGRNLNGSNPWIRASGSTITNSSSTGMYYETANLDVDAIDYFTVDTGSTIDLRMGITCQTNGGSVWPSLVKTGTGLLMLGGGTTNSALTLNVQEGWVYLNKASSQDVHATYCTAVMSGASIVYGGSGDYQIQQNGRVELWGGTLDFNGRNQIGTDPWIRAAGSTIANTALTTSTLTPNSVTLDANVTVNTIGNLKIDGVMSGTGMLTKTGVGTLTLTKANMYSGGTFVNQGTLVADFTATGAPTTDILKSNAALTLAGGTLHTLFYIPGNSQTVSGTTVASGASGVLADIAGGTVNLNAITRNTAGGTVNFTTAQGANIRTSTANCNFSSRRSILGGYATYGGTTWAVSGTTGGPWNISGLGTFQPTFAATNDVNASGSNTISSSVAINSLRFDSSGATTVNINSSTNKTLTVATGGILMTPNAGAVTISSTGTGTGSLATGNGYDLIVHQNNISNTMTISANIMGTSRGLTKSGAGRLILSGSKSYTGVTTVNEGTLALSSGTLSGTSGITLNAGGTLLQNSSTALNKSITFNGGTLGGTGWYSTPVANGIVTVGNGSHLSPGNGGVGTLTISATYDNLTLNMDSSTVLDFDFGTSSGTCDKIVLSTRTSRHLTLDGTLNIYGPSVAQGDYTIISGASSITDMGLILPTDGYMGHQWSYVCSNGNVIITASPEPGTIAILATALLSFLAYVWRKRK